MSGEIVRCKVLCKHTVILCDTSGVLILLCLSTAVLHDPSLSTAVTEWGNKTKIDEKHYVKI